MAMVIYHNPNCGTSRNVVKFATDAGLQPTVIEYLQTGWTRAQLLGLFAAANLTPREALRTHKSPAEELGLTASDISENALFDAMVEHPILVNRPIVCSPKGVALCRPSEKVFDLMATLPAGPLYKEDGEMVINDKGKRLD